MDGRPLVQPPILPGLKSLGKSRRGNAAGAPSGVDSGGGTLQRLDLLAVLVAVALSGDRRAVVLRRMDDLPAVHGTVLRAGFVPQLGALPGARIAVRSEDHTSELQSLMRISYAVFCLKTKNK